MKIGYARVSKKDQNINLQIDALKAYGCEVIYSEKVSGFTNKRDALEKMLKEVQSGDIVVVNKLDRLGRSVIGLVSLVKQLKEENVDLVSLNDPIDTTTASGMLIFNIYASMAEHERQITVERTLAGLEAARKRGRFGGRRPFDNIDDPKVQYALLLYQQGDTIMDIRKKAGMSGLVLYRFLKRSGIKMRGKGGRFRPVRPKVYVRPQLYDCFGKPIDFKGKEKIKV